MTKGTDSKVPKIRFKGFVGEWEHKNLGEIYTERNERGNDSLQILSVSIHSGVSKGELDSAALGKQVRRSEDKLLYKHVNAGDLVFNMMRAWQGAVGVATIEGMVSPAYITAAPNSATYPLFMDVCLRRSEIIAQMNNLSYGVTDFRKRLYWDSFVRVESYVPTASEQKKLTAYFSHLDDLIAQHQRKHDKLVTLKQAMLQKMFPQDGATTPEIRFKGFEGEWKTKRVDEIAPLQRGFDLPTTKVRRGEYPVVYSNGILRSHNEYQCEAPGVVTGRSGTIGKVTFVTEDYWPHNTSLWVTNFFDNDPLFIYYFYVQFKLGRFDAGSTVPTLNRNDVHGVKAKIPSPPEQAKIGLYFRSLDKLISKHSTQLEKLKSIKSACLEKMFA